MAIISIGRSSSLCLSCDRGASPTEDGHNTILAYGPSGGKPGCGESWTGVRIDYTPSHQGFVYENLRGLPLEAFDAPEGTTYPYEK